MEHAPNATLITVAAADLTKALAAATEAMPPTDNPEVIVQYARGMLTIGAVPPFRGRHTQTVWRLPYVTDTPNAACYAYANPTILTQLAETLCGSFATIGITSPRNLITVTPDTRLFNNEDKDPT